MARPRARKRRREPSVDRRWALEHPIGASPSLEASGRADDWRNYNLLEVLVSLGLPFPSDPWDREPLDYVVSLIETGDQLMLDEKEEGDQQDYRFDHYELAVELIKIPGLQLELGCVLLQRATPPEEPLCEHMFIGEDFGHWEAQVLLHDKVGAGEPITDQSRRRGVIQIALRAYVNAFTFYSASWGHPSFDLVRSLFALDGMRVCYQELNRPEELWELSKGLGGFLKDAGFELGKYDRELEYIVARIEERFAKSRRPLQPMMAGREEARQRLEREFGSYWEWVPQRVKEYLVDAEWKRSLLKDPSYDLWDVAHSYSLAIEELVQFRVGRKMDEYLTETASADERTKFEKKYLGGGKRRSWKAAGLTLDQYERYLRDPGFREVMTAAGLDNRYFVGPEGKGRSAKPTLRQQLASVIPFRTQTAHPPKHRLTDARFQQLRDLVLSPKRGIIPRLSLTRILVDQESS